MSLFEQLKETYLNERVEPYGQVVVIPVKAFQNEWKQQLEAEGVKVFSSNYGMQSAFFLRKGERQASATEESSIQQPAIQEKSVGQKWRLWTEDDEKKLEELYSQGKTMREMAEEFDRTIASVNSKIHDMGLQKPSSQTTAKPEKQVKRKKKGWTEEEKMKLKQLHDQGLSNKEIAERLGKSVFQVGGAIRYLPHITPLPERGSSTEKTNPQLELGNPDIVKELLTAASVLYPNYRHACAFLLKEASNKILQETTP